MLRWRGLVTAALFALEAAACTQQHARAVALETALHQAYPGARFDVTFAGGPGSLEITVDSAGFRNYRLDSHQLHTIAEAMAQFTLQHYAGAAALDTVTVQFIQEQSGALFWRSRTYQRESFSVAALHP
jgi:hypothetical protein